MSPLQRWITWFEGLPPELRKMLGFHLAVLGRGTVPVPEGAPLEGAGVGLCERLRAAADDALSEAGLAVSLVALTDFVFRRRGRRESWIAEERQHDRLIARAAAAGNAELADRVRRSRERLPFRSRQWIRAGEGWALLRSSVLAEDTIERWLGEALAPVAAH